MKFVGFKTHNEVFYINLDDILCFSQDKIGCYFELKRGKKLIRVHIDETLEEIEEKLKPELL